MLPWGVIHKLRNSVEGTVAGHAAWMIGGAAAQAVVAFLANLALVRLLLPEDFGRFALIQANVSLVGAVANLQINTVVRRTPEEELTDRRLSLLGSALVVQIMLVCLGAFLLLWSTGAFCTEAMIVLVTSAAASWVTLQVCLYERRLDYQRIARVETGAHLASQLFAVAGAVLGLGPIVLYLRVPVQLVGKAGALQLMGALRWFPLCWLNLDGWKLIFRQVQGFWADGVLEQSLERIVLLLVGGLGGERSAGYFFQSRRLATIPHQLLQPVAYRMGITYFSHRAPKGRRKRLLMITLVLAGTVLVLTAMMTVLLARPVVPRVFGPDWSPVVPLLIAMVGIIVGVTLFDTLKAYFMACGQMRTFMAFGRTAQYAALGLAVLLISRKVVEAPLGLAIGLSSGFVLAVVILSVAAWRSKQ